MAFDFTAALKNIATAVYGRDMRKALHDTIEDLDSRTTSNNNSIGKVSSLSSPDGGAKPTNLVDAINREVSQRKKEVGTIGNLNPPSGSGAKPTNLVDAINQEIAKRQDDISGVNTHKSAAVLDHPDKSVTTRKIADGAISQSKLSNDSVSQSKIIDGAVTKNKIGDGAVTTDKIADGSVTEEKLAEDVLRGTFKNPISIRIDELDNTWKQGWYECGYYEGDDWYRSLYQVIDNCWEFDVTLSQENQFSVTQIQYGDYGPIMFRCSPDSSNSYEDSIKKGFSEWISIAAKQYLEAKPYTLVAASNSSADTKAIADYVCTGSNDEITINQAITATEDGGEVVLAKGQYNLNGRIIIDVKQDAQHPHATTLRGCGTNATMLAYSGSDCAIYTNSGAIIGSYGWKITINDLCIQLDSENSTGIKINDGSDGTGTDVRGIEIYGSGNPCIGVDIVKGSHRIQNCAFYDCDIRLQSGTKDCVITGNWLGTTDAEIINQGGTQHIIANHTGFSNKSTITVAAYNSSDTDKINVDFVCDGKTDHIVISNAIAALPASGGKVVLMPGSYLIGSSINTDVKKSVWIQGCGDGTQLLGATSTVSFFSARGTSRTQGMELRVSDLTICNNTSKIKYLVEDISNYKSADFENVTFRSNYIIPNGFNYASATYTYADNFGSLMFDVLGTSTDFEDALTFVNCRLITDYAFNYTLQDVVMKNFCVIGSKGNIKQTFNVEHSDVDIRAPRGGLTINANGNARVAKTYGVTVNLSGTGNIAY